MLVSNVQQVIQLYKPICVCVCVCMYSLEIEKKVTMHALAPEDLTRVNSGGESLLEGRGYMEVLWWWF